MKRFSKLLALVLMAGLVALMTAGVLFGAPTMPQATQMSIEFSAESGIRWNPGFGVFEVFSTAGVSYIGSDKYISVTGEVRDTAPSDSEEALLFSQAGGAKSYHIMQDIAYDEAAAMNVDFKTFGAKKDISDGGIVNGRGFFLKNFPLRGGSSLFGVNNGTIRNINVLDPVWQSGNDNSGIICNTNNGVMEYCTVASSNVGALLNITAAMNIGAIAYTGSGTFQNCVNRLNFNTSGAYAGGILSNGGTAAGGKFIDCLNTGNINSTVSAASVYIGGIAGVINGTATLNNCKNSGAIKTIVTYTVSTPHAYAGGIAGDFNKASTLNNCTNSGVVSVDCKNADAGGIVGAIEETLTLNNCTNSGNITAFASGNYANAGGIIGAIKSASTLNKCINSGKIITDGVYNYVGGIAGYIGSKSTLAGCTNNGDITNTLNNGSRQAYAGGIVGQIYNSILMDCTNSGSVFAEVNKRTAAGDISAAGGNVGWIMYDAQISNCHNTGNVKGKNPDYSTRAGGIAGWANGYAAAVPKITASTNRGPITVESAGNSTIQYNNGIGGIVGYIDMATTNYKYTVENCINYGIVSSIYNYTHAGGIIGYIYGSANASELTIKGCVNQNTVSVSGVSVVSYAGGIAGYQYGTEAKMIISECINNSIITVNASINNVAVYVGGIAGYNSAANTAISYCANSGIIRAVSVNISRRAGGIISQSNSADTTNTSGGKAVGTYVHQIAFAGGAGAVTNCLNTGIVSDV